MTTHQKELFEKAEFLFGARDGHVEMSELTLNFKGWDISTLIDMHAIRFNRKLNAYEWIWVWPNAR